MQVYDTEDIGGKNEMVMELDCTWHSDVEVGISVQPVPKAKIPVVQGAVLVDRAFNFLTSLIKVKASVQRLYLQGRVMVTLRPLMPAPPLVGSVQVAFAEVPDYSFDLLLFGGDTSVLPGLENFLYSVIKDNVLRQYTLPERFVLPLIPEDQLRADRPRGVLEVEIVEAENVPRMDLFSASDPYVRLFTRVGRQYSTQVVQNSKSPVWNERFMTLVHYPESQLATFILMDYDTFGKVRSSPLLAPSLWLASRQGKVLSPRALGCADKYYTTLPVLKH